MQKTVSIIGCGWFGFPMAKELLMNDYVVKGSTTTEAKLELLEKNGIQPYLIRLDENESSGDLQEFLKSDIVIINLPPGRHSNKTAIYFSKIKRIYHELSSDQKVIFISSTSVYPAINDTVTEDMDLSSEKDSGKVLLECEQLFYNERSTILRFSGLFGPDRLPGRFLAGKRDLKNGDAPVNMVHLYDCIGVVLSIIEKACWGEVFNVCADEHPTRKEFYTKAAQNIGLEVPQFNGPTTSWKRVSNEKLKHKLGYYFKVQL